ncbi:MAG: hypothetical protein LBD84_05470 [Campylobacteraceae bacterium]|jgi:hypothetical protein|nr:hypothetical protein [Campylobacteraceae bacterium]
MANKMKKANFISDGGILLMLFGIFLLYMRAQCIRRGDFYPIYNQNIYLIAPLCLILTGLFGKFKLSKAINI